MGAKDKRRSGRTLQQLRQSSQRQKVPIFLLACVIGFGFIAYPHLKAYITSIQQTIFTHMREVTTSQLSSSSTAAALATSIAQTQATTTALELLQANYAKITSMPPTIDDQMHNPDLYNWDTGLNCTFIHKVYQASVTQRGYFTLCTARKTQLGNFAYQVHLKIAHGDAGGITFRTDVKTNRTYLFNIGQDGSYSISYYPGDPAQRTSILSHGFSDTIITGHEQENIITVIAQKETLNFYVNAKYLTSVQDTQLIEGQIGIIANDNRHNTDVICNRVQIWKL